MRKSLASAITAAALFVCGIANGHAHEGHDHGPQPVVQKDAAPRGEAASELLELVAVARGAELVIYLDRFGTNEPVTDATVEVETPEGQAVASASTGAYRLKAPWLEKPGQFDLIFTVTVGGAVDVLPVSIAIPGGAAATASVPATVLASMLQPATGLALGAGLLIGIGLAAVGRRRAVPVAVLLAAALLHASGQAQAQQPTAPDTDRATRGIDGAVFVPKPIQRVFGLRTLVTEVSRHPRAIELPGRIIPDPNASGYVQASVGGRLSPPPGGFPRLGTAVKQGDVLALVTPPLQAIDLSDMRQRQGELDQQIDIVGRRVGRYERLAPSGAIPASQLEESRLELQGLKDRRAALDRARREPEALVAPVSGVIADGTAIAGQMAQPNAVIFHIVDPTKLWIEALSFDALAASQTASAMTANGRTLTLSFRGSGFADRNQSIPMHFSVNGESNGLRAGQFVTVFVASDEAREGIALPRASLVRSANGQDFVYVHTAAERFQPRPVRAEPLDGERVLISAGIEPKQRVVSQGADLLDHVR
ncbi:MAG: RND transporter [Alphaproteobacteria bacterium]|nr:RND transporter [Alphaproteobacteria bacterium]